MDVKTLCLGVLSRGDASGYEIKKACEEGPFGHFQDASFGSIYPALAKLSAEKLVDCEQLSQEKRPDKKVYSITESGRAALLEMLVIPPSPDKVNSDFYFITFFAQMMPAETLRGLLERRIAWYEETIARMKSCDMTIKPAGERFTHGLGLAHYQTEVTYLKANMEQLLREVGGSDIGDNEDAAPSLSHSLSA